MSLLNESIRKIVRGMVTPSIIPAEVTAFNSDDWTITCKIDNLEIDEIRVKSVINTDDTGILIEPKVGSKVLLGKIDGKAEALVVLKYDEIVKYRLIADLIEFNGDDYSVVKAEELQQILTINKTFIDAFKNILSVPINEPGNGSPSAFQTALNTALASLDYKDGQGIENETVKHG